MHPECHDPPSCAPVSRSSFSATLNIETMIPVSYKVGYFKHVSSAAVFKKLGELRRRLEQGADWQPIETVQELHRLLVDSTTHNREGETSSSTCSQNGTGTPHSSPRCIDLCRRESLDRYPMADVAVQVDTCFDDLDEFSQPLEDILYIDGISQPPEDFDGIHDGRQNLPHTTPRKSAFAGFEALKKPLLTPRSALASSVDFASPSKTTVFGALTPSRGFWKVSDETTGRICELEETVEYYKQALSEALAKAELLQETLHTAKEKLEISSSGEASDATTQGSIASAETGGENAPQPETQDGPSATVSTATESESPDSHSSAHRQEGSSGWVRIRTKLEYSNSDLEQGDAGECEGEVTRKPLPESHPVKQHPLPYCNPLSLQGDGGMKSADWGGCASKEVEALTRQEVKVHPREEEVSGLRSPQESPTKQGTAPTAASTSSASCSSPTRSGNGSPMRGARCSEWLLAVEPKAGEVVVVPAGSLGAELDAGEAEGGGGAKHLHAF